MITLAEAGIVLFAGAGGASVAEPEDAGATVLSVGTGGALVADAENGVEATVPLVVETGGPPVDDEGSSDGEGGSSVGDGGTSVGEPWTGATKVVELTGTMMLDATGVLLTKIVVTLGETTGVNSTGEPVALPAGTLVVVFSNGGVNV